MNQATQIFNISERNELLTLLLWVQIIFYTFFYLDLLLVYIIMFPNSNILFTISFPLLVLLYHEQPWTSCFLLCVQKGTSITQDDMCQVPTEWAWVALGQYYMLLLVGLWACVAESIFSLSFFIVLVGVICLVGLV